jgi:CHAT domain-containing protein/tetratricopeptide (TPR) repeat protein
MGEDPDALLRRAQDAVNAGHYPEAIKDGTEAVSIFRQSGDLPKVARALTSSGLAHMYSGDYGPALQQFTEARDCSHQAHDLDYEITSLNNIGTVRYFQGRYADAMDRYREAMTNVETAPREKWYSSRRQLTMANTAILYQTLSQNDRALVLYRELLDSPAALPASEQAQLLANVGVLRRRLGDPQKALATYREAQALYQRAGHRDGEIAVLNNIGILQAADLQQWDDAAATFGRALSLAEQIGDHLLALQAHLHRGEAFYRAGKWTASGLDFAAAATASKTLGAHEEEWKADYGLGRIALQGNDLAAGRDLLRKAVTLIEAMRADLRGSSLRSAFLTDKRDVYDLLIENTTSLDETFQLMERSRARTLRDRAGQKKNRTPQEIAIGLPTNTAILEYWIGDSSAAVLYISNRQTGVKRWKFDAAQRDAISSLPAALADPKRGDWAAAARVPSASLLAAVPPLADPRITKLIVVPDGALAQLPFEVLAADGKLLVEKFAISYAPSAALAVTEPSHRPTRWFWQTEMNAFADPAPGNGPDSGVVSARWSRLPGANREVNEIARVLVGRADIFTGSLAAKGPLLATNHAPILHFATHAFSDLENPALSYILLAPPPSGPDRFDYLFLKEVADLPLTGVDLVTLSACQTAAGKSVPGEGMESFSHAFLAADVPSVVTSLWSVSDRTTADFMVRFYRRLSEGVSKAEALRDAKLDFLHSANASHPAYWAAFLLDGDGASSLAYVVAWYWLLIPAAVLLAILATAIRMRARTA